MSYMVLVYATPDLKPTLSVYAKALVMLFLVLELT